MGTIKSQKKKAKRKNKLKARSKALHAARQSERAEYFPYEAQYQESVGNPEKAISLFKKALKADPKNRGILYDLVHLGRCGDNRTNRIESLIGR